MIYTMQRLFETNVTERNNIYVATKWRHNVDISSTARQLL